MKLLKEIYSDVQKLVFDKMSYDPYCEEQESFLADEELFVAYPHTIIGTNLVVHIPNFGYQMLPLQYTAFVTEDGNNITAQEALNPIPYKVRKPMDGIQIQTPYGVAYGFKGHHTEEYVRFSEKGAKKVAKLMTEKGVDAIATPFGYWKEATDWVVAIIDWELVLDNSSLKDGCYYADAWSGNAGARCVSLASNPTTWVDSNIPEFFKITKNFFAKHNGVITVIDFLKFDEAKTL